MRTFSAPISRGKTMQNRGPSINGRKKTIVCHSEYLGDVAGSAAFSNTPYAVNPGLVQSFPWAAAIATQYEQYRFTKLTYRYETDAASTKAGVVILVTDYDALDSPFVSKDQALQYKGASRTVTWTPVQHRVDRQEANPYGLRYVRSSAAPAGGDLKTYDVGNLQVITAGQSDTTTIGELYVDYELELIGPKTNNILGANLLGADIRAGGTINAANPLGSVPSQVDGTTIVVAVNGTSVTLGSTGRFLVYYQAQGTVLGTVTLTPAGGAALVTNYGAATNAGATLATACISMDYETNQGQGLTITLTATTMTFAVLVISQISGAMAVPKPKPVKGLPTIKAEDPMATRIAQLEAMVRRLGLGCDHCGSIGDHLPSCGRARSSLLTTPNMGM
jgi:hypothetical protein